MWDQQSLRSACAYAQSDQSLCKSLEYSISVRLLTEHNLEFLSLKRASTGSSESTLVKMSHRWKLHVAAHLCFVFCHNVLSLPCSLVVTRWERADLLALLYVMFMFLSLS